MAQFSLGRHSYGVPRLIRKAAREQLQSSRAHGCYVATADDIIVGAIVYEVGEACGFIHAIGVQKPWRRQGIATELKHRAVNYFGKSGIKQYYSYVHYANSRMKRLNESRFNLAGEPDETGEYLMYAAQVVAVPHGESLPWSTVSS